VLFPALKATFSQVSYALIVRTVSLGSTGDSYECSSLKSNVYPGPQKRTKKVTFIQVKGNLFPGSRGANTTFIQVQSNLSHGILDVMVTFIQVWRPASRPQNRKEFFCVLLLAMS
jgi:hypothetical protein